MGKPKPNNKKIKTQDPETPTKLKDVSEKSKAIKKEKKKPNVETDKKVSAEVLKNEKKVKKSKPEKTEVVIKAKSQEEIDKKKAKQLAQKQKKLLEKQNANKDDHKGETSETKSNGSVGVKAPQKPAKSGKKKNITNKEEMVRKTHPPNPDAEASTIFVGNLPTTTKRGNLAKLFGKFGPVTSIRIRTATGKHIFKHKQRKEAGSLNAYLLLKNPETATKALEMNGTEFKDRHIRVTLANTKTCNNDDPKRTVFVGNLKYSANEESLREIFSSCGEIDYVRCIGDGKNNCKGIAYVCFKSPEAVGLAVELNGTIVDERPINVERYSVNKLGAREARDKAAKADPKLKTGAARRLAGGKSKKNKNPSKESTPNAGEEGAKKVKKEKFSGVKVNGISSKKNQKKKIPGQMQKLAKKIAPLKA